MKIYYNPKLKQLSRNLRNHSTMSEVLLWNELKSKKMCSFQFMRQKPIGNFIVDFFCSKLKLVIEIDGASHDLKKISDKKRDAYLQSLGLTVLHFEDHWVKENIQWVVSEIKKWIEENEYKKKHCCGIVG
ncbi:MAG: DUF559 domain-containing protein [Candidatus Marinimicrobia bacterium]|nr:DUF559 domain-containing protein [Candidatus Neomarinimicrobiota bacterium]